MTYLLIDFGFWTIPTQFKGTSDAIRFLKSHPDKRSEVERRRTHCLERGKQLQPLDVTMAIRMYCQAQFCREALEA